VAEVKDPLTFLQAAINVSRLTKHEFTLVGEGNLLDECRALAKGRENIKIRGWLKQEVVNDLMRETDVFCQLDTCENIWAATLISAMKHGKAIICTNVGYTSRYLKHGYHALLIPPRDPIALADAIAFLANHPEVREELGKNASSFIKENMSIDKISREIHSLLFDLVKRNK